MLERKPLPERSRSPPPKVDTNSKSTQTSPPKPEAPPHIPQDPVVVFIARASNGDDHDYPNITLTADQMHEYLRSLLIIVVAEHRKRFGILGTRQIKMQTLVQPGNRKISPTSRVGKFLRSALEEARAMNTDCIFGLLGWDGWTTDQETIADLCDQFRDVHFFLHIYANRASPRDFFEVNAHKFNAYYLQKVTLDDDVVIRDRSTALFIRMIEALPTLEYASCLPRIPSRERAALSKYDNRFADVDGDESEARKRGV